MRGSAVYWKIMEHAWQRSDTVACAGKWADSEGLANAVTDYWHSLTDEFGHGEFEVDGMNSSPVDHELAPRTAKEWFRRKGYRWAGLKRGASSGGA